VRFLRLLGLKIQKIILLRNWVFEGLWDIDLMVLRVKKHIAGSFPGLYYLYLMNLKM
jgi:hypothetical protein